METIAPHFQPIAAKAIITHFEVLEDKKTDSCVFPVDALPGGIRTFVKECADVYRTPIDYWAGAVISATALGIGNKLKLKTKYENLPILWSCLVGDVSSGKSEAISLIFKPFRKKDDADMEVYRESLKGWLSAGKEGLKPEHFQYILNDYTPESLSDVHSINDRGLIIIRDELKGWIDDFNRYNKSGEQSNMLSSWSGIGMVYNRKGTYPISISCPVINVIGGMQPDILQSLAGDLRAENGFTSRMVFYYPDTTAKPEYNQSIINSTQYNGWERFIDELVGLPEQMDINLNDAAAKVYADWFNQNATSINNETSGYLKGVYGKLDIISLRIAIVLKAMDFILDNDDEAVISEKQMKNALLITEYFRGTALRVSARISKERSLQKRDVIDWVMKEMQKTKSEISKFFETSRSQINRIEKS